MQTRNKHYLGEQDSFNVHRKEKKIANKYRKPPQAILRSKENMVFMDIENGFRK